MIKAPENWWKVLSAMKENGNEWMGNKAVSVGAGLNSQQAYSVINGLMIRKLAEKNNDGLGKKSQFYRMTTTGKDMIDQFDQDNPLPFYFNRFKIFTKSPKFKKTSPLYDAWPPVMRKRYGVAA